MRHHGFTLIELMITLAIIALLATITIPLAEVTLQRQKERDLHLALNEIRSALDAYKKAVDDGHIARTINSSGYPKSLDILEQGVPDARDPKMSKIYFLRRIPKDPMHPDPDVKPADTWGKRSYESEPDNPREGDDIYDVYSLSDKIGLNGVPYRKW